MLCAFVGQILYYTVNSIGPRTWHLTAGTSYTFVHLDREDVHGSGEIVWRGSPVVLEAHLDEETTE